MILKDFYTEKRKAITKVLSENSNLDSNTLIHLYTDNIFTTEINNPVILFKYDTIAWETSSEKTYKADVEFCVSVVLPKGTISATNSYEQAFEYALAIDKAIISEKTDLAFIDTNATFKVHEKQCTNEHEYWSKNDYFIWEITYKTTLIETQLKKRYTLLKNGVSDQDLLAMGYGPLTDQLTDGDGSKYIEINSNTNVAGKVYLNSKQANEAYKQANPDVGIEESILTNSDIDGDLLEDNAVDANGGLVDADKINLTASNNSDQIKTINLNQ